MTCLRTADFYDPEGKDVEIRLDPLLTPQQNAAKYSSLRDCRSGWLPSVHRITWEPWIFWVWNQMSLLKASLVVSRSFWVLFFPTEMRSPEDDRNSIGLPVVRR